MAGWDGGDDDCICCDGAGPGLFRAGEDCVGEEAGLAGLDGELLYDGDDGGGGDGDDGGGFGDGEGGSGGDAGDPRSEMQASSQVGAAT